MADEHPEVIRHQMEETRASLTEKVEALENQVVGTVQNATAAVSETVDNVKQAVQETVESVKETVKNTVEGVKETLDVTEHTQRRPWVMAGGAVAAGFVTGYFLFGRRRHVRPWAGRTDFASAGAAAAPAKPGWLSHLANRFSKELGEIEDLALAAVAGIAKDFVTKTLPHWLEQKVHDTLTTAQPASGYPTRAETAGFAPGATAAPGQAGAFPRHTPTPGGYS